MGDRYSSLAVCILQNSLLEPKEMNTREAIVAERMKRSGWAVIRGGWPDFLCVRKRLGVYQFRALEVKAPTEAVLPHQALNHEALRRAGIDTRVVRAGKRYRLTPSRQVTIKITRGMRRQVERCARQGGMDTAAYIRQLIRENAMNGGKDKK